MIQARDGHGLDSSMDWIGLVWARFLGEMSLGQIIIIRPPGTLVPKAFCFSRDVFLFFNQTQDLRALSADRRETLHSDQHMRQLFNASPKTRGVLP